MSEEAKTQADKFAEALRNETVVRVSVLSEMLSVGLYGGEKLLVPMDRERTAMIWEVGLAAARRQEAVDAAPEGEGR